jgi:tetratricopeptide (TPR) repeat protein
MSFPKKLMFATLIVMLMCYGCKSKDEQKATYLQKGTQFYDKGEFKSAELELKSALQLDPRFVPALKLLGECELKLGKASEAFKTFSNLEGLAPNDVDPKLKLATFFILAKNYKDAEAKIDAALKLAPDNVNALLLRAGIKEHTGAPDAARQIYEHVLKLDEKQQAAYLGLARLEMRQKNPTGAESLLKEGIAKAPDAMQLRLALLNMYQRQGDFDKSEAILADAISTHPKNIALYLLQGQLLASRHKLDAAEASLLKAVALGGNDARPYMAIAQFYDQIGKGDKALEMLLNAVDKNPDDLGVKNALANHYLTHNELDKAGHTIEKILKVNAHFYPALMLKSELMIAKKDFKGAQSLLGDLIKEEPNSATAHYLKGLACIGQKDPLSAMTALSKAVELNPNHYKAKLLLADLHYRHRDFDIAQRLCGEVLKVKPNLLDAKLLKGNIDLAQGHLEKAQAQFQELVAQAPGSPIGYARLAVALRLEKKPDLALEQMEKALALNPKRMDVFSGVISLLVEKGALDDALARCDHHLAKVEGLPAAQAVIYDLKGELFLRKGNTDAAEKAYQKALETNPDFMAPYFALAKLYLRAGKADKAIEQFKAGLEKNPRQPGLNLLLGNLYDAKGQSDLAEKCYRAELDIKPDSVPAMNNLAFLLAQKQKDLDDALHMAQTASEKMPHDPRIMDTLGWVYYQKGLYDSAIDQFTDSLEKTPASAPVLYHLGLAYLRKGDITRAKAQFEKALKIDKNFAGAQDARKRLADL